MVLPPQRVFIFFVHQLADGAHPIPGHFRRQPPGYGRNLITHYQHPVVLPGDMLFNHRGRAEGNGQLESLRHALTALNVQRHTITVVAVIGLNDHWITDFSGITQRAAHRISNFTCWYRYAMAAQKLLGQMLVTGNIDCDAAGLIG